MKFMIVLLAAVACASAGAISPFAYNGLNFGYGYSAPAYSAPLAYSGLGYSGLGYAGLGYSGLGYTGLGYAAPAYSAYAAAPVAVATGFKSQYHAQDELGQASYGHSEPTQTHNAVQDIHGNKIGSYSYISPEGKVIRADYIADAAGFRVASNALPVAPVDTGVAPVDLGVAPLPVQDTPEVVAARAAHFAEVEAVKSRTRRGAILPAATAPLAVAAPLAYSPLAYSAVASPLAYTGYGYGYNNIAAPLAYSGYGYNGLAYSGLASPLAYSAVAAPAVREATLTTVVNNPGHAVSYRVDK